MKFLIKRVAAFGILFSTYFSAYADSAKMYAYGFNNLTSIGCAPVGINNSGRITGYCYIDDTYSSFRAFITNADGGGLTDLGDMGEGSARPAGLNDKAQVVGYTYNNDLGRVTAFITDPGGVNMHALENPRAYAATGINNAGRVVGTYVDDAGVGSAFITGPDGVGFQDLGNLGGELLIPRSINQSGQVVGESDNFREATRGFITGPNGVGIRDLYPEGTRTIFPSSVNDKGEVTGDMDTSDGNVQQFRTGPDGVGLTLLGTLGNYPGGSSKGYAIGRHGVIVGQSTSKPKNFPVVPTVTDPQGHMTDLNKWVVNLPPKVRLVLAAGINRYGQIAASGTDGRTYIVCPTEHCKK